jgi:DNA polymerase III epsilon subunit family exonuclease
MSTEASVVPIGRATSGARACVGRSLEELPGTVRLRAEAPLPAAYAVFDCETTGTDPGVDEIVSLAVVRLDADGIETARYTRLVRPSRPIPAAATAVHGIDDDDVAEAPRFAEIAGELLALLDRAVFVAHNVGFDLPMLQHAFARAGLDYRPAAVACTLEAFRLVEPLADNHRLQSICERRGIALTGAHEAMSDVLATVALLRVLLEEGIAPETVELDHSAYMRLRSRGDTRPASEPQIRRVFGMARPAGLLRPDGGVDRDQVVALVERVAGTADVDGLTRAQVQDVYDALDELIEQRAALAAAAHG